MKGLFDWPTQHFDLIEVGTELVNKLWTSGPYTECAGHPVYTLIIESLIIIILKMNSKRSRERQSEYYVNKEWTRPLKFMKEKSQSCDETVGPSFIIRICWHGMGEALEELSQKS